MTPDPSVDVFGGIRVVELAQWVFVPVTGALLADWGAEVVKIEHPEGGDGYRGLVAPGAAGTGAVNYSMEAANRGKRSLALDLKSEAGREVLLRLVAGSDVFLTNFLPTTLERLRLTVDDLRAVNPSIVYARGHGFGVRGPDASTPAYDATAFWARGAIADTLSPTGSPEPIPQRGALGDRYGAVQLAFGIAGALFRRERTGEASVVDVSLLATALWMVGSDVLSTLQGTFRPSPAAGRSREAPPNPLAANFRCADGRWLALCCLQPDRYWADLCRVLGLDRVVGDPRFTGMADRTANSAACMELLDAAFATRDVAGWRPLLDGARIPWAPFQRVDELLADPQVEANGYLGHGQTSDGTPYRMPTGAVQFDEQPAALRPAPKLGEGAADLLASLGYSPDEILALQVSGTLL